MFLNQRPIQPYSRLLVLKPRPKGKSVFVPARCMFLELVWVFELWYGTKIYMRMSIIYFCVNMGDPSAIKSLLLMYLGGLKRGKDWKILGSAVLLFMEHCLGFLFFDNLLYCGTYYEKEQCISHFQNEKKNTMQYCLRINFLWIRVMEGVSVCYILFWFYSAAGEHHETFFFQFLVFFSPFHLYIFIFHHCFGCILPANCATCTWIFCRPR